MVLEHRALLEAQRPSRTAAAAGRRSQWMNELIDVWVWRNCSSSDPAVARAAAGTAGRGAPRPHDAVRGQPRVAGAFIELIQQTLDR